MRFSGGGAGTPGGSNTHVQYNDSGAFGGEAAFTYDKSTNTLSVENAAVTSLTAGRVVYVGTSDVLADDSGLTWDATNNILSITPSGAFPGSDPLALGIERTILTAPGTAPGAVNPLVGVYGTFAQSGAVNQGRIGIFASVGDDSTVVNKTITGAASDGSGANEIRITATSHGFATGDRISIYGVGGTTEANGVWTITVITANTFDLDGSTFTNAYTSGGTATNRGLYYAATFNVRPALDRDGVSLTGTAANGDDVACVTLSNDGAGKATDGIFITDASISGGSKAAWNCILASDSDVDTFISYYGKVYSVGIDLSAATVNTTTIPMIKMANGHLFTIGTSAASTLTNRTIDTDADGTIGVFDAVGQFTKNDTNTRAFSTVRVKPTLNFGGSNTNTTVNVLEVDSTNTATTGATVNLFKASYGGSQRLSLSSGGTLALTGAQTIATGTITSSTPAVDISQTWNSGGVTFTGFKSNITNTASASASLLADFQVGGTSRLYLDVAGNVLQRAADAGSTGFTFDNHGGGTGGTPAAANTTTNNFIGRVSSGTNATPLRTKSAQVLMRISGGGYSAATDGTTAAQVAAHKGAYDIVATEDWTSSANGTILRFRTTAAGGTTANAKAFISEQGLELSTGNATPTARAGTNGTNTLRLFNGTAPTSTLTNGVDIYSGSGELRVIDAAGNDTLLSPHDKDGNWIHEETNYKGRKLRVDMEKLIKALDAMLGGGYVTEG